MNPIILDERLSAAAELARGHWRAEKPPLRRTSAATTAGCP